MIGDSVMDIKCGNNYGAYTIAYLSNPKREKDVSEIANTSIRDLADIKTILDSDISFTYNKL